MEQWNRQRLSGLAVEIDQQQQDTRETGQLISTA